MDRFPQKAPPLMIAVALAGMLIFLCPAPDLSTTEPDVVQFSSAKSFGDVFSTVSKTELQTTAECPISHISDMAVDAGGNLLIADGWQSRGVYVFSPDGKFLRELGRKGQGPGEYANPISVEIAPNREIWVADYGNNRLSIYAEDLSFRRQIICRPRILHYLHLNSRCEIFMYRSQANPLKPDTSDTIFRYDDQGTMIGSFAPFPKEALEVKFWAAQDGMTIGNDDCIYEMNPLYYQIRKFSPEGDLIASFGRKTDLFEVVKGEGKTPILVYGPFYLEMAEKGLIVAHVNKHLEIYDTNGRFVVGKLPFDYRILGTKGNRMYAEFWEEAERDQLQLNPTIIVLRLK